RLDEQRLVVAELAERADDRVEALPVSGGAAGAAVDDEILRGRRDPRGEGRPPRSADDARGRGGRRHISHRWPSVVSSLARSMSLPLPRPPWTMRSLPRARGARGALAAFHKRSIHPNARRRRAARPT